MANYEEENSFQDSSSMRSGNRKGGFETEEYGERVGQDDLAILLEKADIPEESSSNWGEVRDSFSNRKSPTQNTVLNDHQTCAVTKVSTLSPRTKQFLQLCGLGSRSPSSENSGGNQDVPRVLDQQSKEKCSQPFDSTEAASSHPGESAKCGINSEDIDSIKTSEEAEVQATTRSSEMPPLSPTKISKKPYQRSPESSIKSGRSAPMDITNTSALVGPGATKTVSTSFDAILSRTSQNTTPTLFFKYKSSNFVPVPKFKRTNRIAMPLYSRRALTASEIEKDVRRFRSPRIRWTETDRERYFQAFMSSKGDLRLVVKQFKNCSLSDIVSFHYKEMAPLICDSLESGESYFSRTNSSTRRRVSAELARRSMILHQEKKRRQEFTVNR